MSMNSFLRRCVFERPMKLPKGKGKLKQGADSVNVRVIENGEKKCILEAEIIKRVPDLFNIELVYQAECDKDKSCKQNCDVERQVKRMLTLEANLLVSNILKEMDFPPFPVLLGDLDEKSENERHKNSKKKG